MQPLTASIYWQHQTPTSIRNTFRVLSVAMKWIKWVRRQRNTAASRKFEPVCHHFSLVIIVVNNEFPRVRISEIRPYWKWKDAMIDLFTPYFISFLIAAQVTCDSGLKSVDFYDSKFDLGALSIADLSLQSSSDTQDFAEFKRAIKFSLFFQPAFSTCWFLGVVALENRQSCIMPVTFIVCYNILVSAVSFPFFIFPSSFKNQCPNFRFVSFCLQNWYILLRFQNLSPILPQPKTNESNLKSSKKLSQFDSNFSISDEVNQTPGCTDTIPLLCSVTGNGGGNNNNNNSATGNSNANDVNVAMHHGITGSTATLQSSNVCLSKQLSLEDIIYKTSISQWDASMENINLDCISTISNWRGGQSGTGRDREREICGISFVCDQRTTYMSFILWKLLDFIDMLTTAH